MPAPNILTAERLFRLIGRHDTPILIDVRSDADAAADRRLLPGSMRRPAETVPDWGRASRAGRWWSCAPRAMPGAKGSQPGFGRRAPPPRSLRVATPPGAQPSCPSCPKTASRRATRMVQRSGSRGPAPRSTGLPAPGSFVASSIPRPGSFSCPRPKSAAWPNASARHPSTSRARTSSGAIAASAAASTPWSRSSALPLRHSCASRPSCAARTPLGSIWHRKSPGLLAASLGLSRMYADDLEQLEAGMATLRRLLSLVPRRDRRDPQLAEQQGGSLMR